MVRRSVVDGELRSTGVVRAVEDVDINRELGTSERGAHAFVIGKVKDPADIEEYGFRSRHRAKVAVRNSHEMGPNPWYR